MQNQFRIRLCGDLNYEEMVADLVYKNNTIATISQEMGIENMRIEIFPPVNAKSWEFPLRDFIEIIERAKKNLIEMQKIPDEELNND